MYPESQKEKKKNCLLNWSFGLVLLHFQHNIRGERAKDGIQFADFASIPDILQSQFASVPSDNGGSPFNMCQHFQSG